MHELYSLVRDDNAWNSNPLHCTCLLHHYTDCESSLSSLPSSPSSPTSSSIDHWNQFEQWLNESNVSSDKKQWQFQYINVNKGHGVQCIEELKVCIVYDQCDNVNVYVGRRYHHEYPTIHYVISTI